MTRVSALLQVLVDDSPEEGLPERSSKLGRCPVVQDAGTKLGCLARVRVEEGIHASTPVQRGCGMPSDTSLTSRVWPSQRWNVSSTILALLLIFHCRKTLPEAIHGCDA